MRTLFVFCFIMCMLRCTGQQYYETYTPANGLVDARVNKIMQDGSGRLFFLTRDGFSIFDGQRFTNHTRIGHSPIGIINDGIMLPDGSLRLVAFNGNWLECKKRQSSPDTVFYRNIPEVSAILDLPGNEKIISANFGLYHYKNNTAEKINLLNSSPFNEGRVIERAVIAGNHLVYTRFPDNQSLLFICDIRTGVVTDSLTTTGIFNLSADEHTGRVNVCTGNGLWQLNSEAAKEGRLQFEEPWFRHLIPAGFIPKQVFTDRQKNTWLIHEALGCIRIDAASGDLHRYTPDDGLLTGVVAIYQDRENNYWFISPGKGVQKLVQTSYELTTEIKGEPVQPVYFTGSAEDGSVFFSTSEQMLVLKKGLLTKIPWTRPGYRGPVYYWKKNYWTYDGEEILINNKGGKIQLGAGLATDNKPHYASSNFAIDRKGNMLLSGNYISVVQQNMTASSQPLPYFTDIIAIDEQNDYWAFCRSNDIVQYSWQDNSLKKMASFNHPGIEPRFVIHWNKDTFCVASRSNGILFIKANSQGVSIAGQLDRQQGLSNDFAETLLRIDRHRLAVGTASGFDIITMSAGDTAIENVSAYIGHFEPITMLSRGDNGIVYAGTETQQLFTYNPFYNRQKDIAAPQTWFSSITVNNRPVDTTHNLFAFQQNNFSFSVTSPTYLNNRSVVFHFVLESEKKSWEQNSQDATFSIANLEPGNYRLTVHVKYPGRVYADQQLHYHFTIRPPFWKTWWFIAGSIVLFGLLLYYLIRNQYRQQLKKQKMLMDKELAIEQERTRMARELHDGLGSMLSGIKHSFAAMKNQLPLDEKGDAQFDSNIEKLDESIKELRGITHTMASDSLLAYGLENSLRDYCRNLSQSGPLKISFEALSTGNLSLGEDQSFHIFRIVQELLQNITKHAAATQAIVQLSYNNDRLYITVEDNGKGYTPADAEKGMGLKNIESRILTLKGKMDYRSAPGKGTSVLIEIPT